MRLDDYRTSDNVSDQRGQNFGGGGFGGGGGGGLGLLIGLVASRFGIVGIVVLLLVGLLLGFSPFGGGGGGSGVVSPSAPRQVQGARNASQSCGADAVSRFSCQVLASTEDSWAALFRQAGGTYQPATLVFYDGRGMSGCGAAQAAMGPFYCPSDNGIYLDTGFFDELRTRYAAQGDFAQAYVIAHEVGHHVQTVTGTSDRVRALQARASRADGNRIQVAMELQADCYAGVWAAQNRNRLEPGDVEEGMTAAAAIGDDTLQRAAGQRPVPESFTHGTSAERQQWLRRGLQSGDPAQCDTFRDMGLALG